MPAPLRRERNGLKIAIVSDPLVQRGGAERVVEALAEAFPEAALYAILYSERTGPASLAGRVRTSWLDRIPGASRRHRAFFPFYRSAIESLDLSAYDVIISSHHTVAKGLLRSAEQIHICYCHTPMRALWERQHQELGTIPALARPAVNMLFSSMRVWDYASAARVDRFVANGEVTKERIRKHYGRESVVIHPPIDTERFTTGDGTGDYYLVASRAVPYKRREVAVAGAVAAGRKVIVTGGGEIPGFPSSDLVEYRGHVRDRELIDLMRGARALLFPANEDFGMTPLEMNACGRPVIAYGAGGALETVRDGETGILVDAQTPDAFAAGIARFEQLRFEREAVRMHALRFSKERFVEAMRAFVDEVSGISGGA